MLDSASNMISTADAYYFQLYPLSLAVTNPECDLPSPGTTYRFTILKGISFLIQDNRNSIKLNSPLRPTSRM